VTVGGQGGKFTGGDGGPKKGWIGVHTKRTNVFAKYGWQCKPGSQLMSATHVCPSCMLKQIDKKEYIK